MFVMKLLYVYMLLMFAMFSCDHNFDIDKSKRIVSNAIQFDNKNNVIIALNCWFESVRFPFVSILNYIMNKLHICH